MLLETPRLGSGHEPLSEPLRTWRRHQAARAGGPPSRDRRRRGPARQGPAGGARAHHAHHGAGMGWGGGIGPVPGKADSGDLSEDLADLFIELGVVARAHQTGVALFLDEVQNLSAEDLSALIMALHRVNQKSMPVIVVAAG